jgi:hypothetical protein
MRWFFGISRRFARRGRWVQHLLLAFRGTQKKISCPLEVDIWLPKFFCVETKRLDRAPSKGAPDELMFMLLKGECGYDNV